MEEDDRLSMAYSSRFIVAPKVARCVATPSMADSIFSSVVVRSLSKPVVAKELKLPDMGPVSLFISANVAVVTVPVTDGSSTVATIPVALAVKLNCDNVESVLALQGATRSVLSASLPVTV